VRRRRSTLYCQTVIDFISTGIKGKAGLAKGSTIQLFMHSTVSITSVFKTLAVVASATTFALPAIARPTASCQGVVEHAVQLYTYAYPLVVHNTTAHYTGKGENQLTGFLEVAAGPQVVIQMNVDTVYTSGESLLCLHNPAANSGAFQGSLIFLRTATSLRFQTMVSSRTGQRHAFGLCRP